MRWSRACWLAVLASSTACGPEPIQAECSPYDEVFVYLDEDGDGFGSEPIGYVCEPGPNESTNNVDCDDTEATSNPTTEEICDLLDNNCNGRIDEGFPILYYYPDNDGDGFGDRNGELESCTDPGEGWTFDSRDCNDEAPGAFPGGTEVCDNGIDDDCDGRIDDTLELCDDGFDNNCDDLVDCDDPDCNGNANCQLPCVDNSLPNSASVSVSGSTSGQGDDVTPPCGFSTAPDVSFQWVAPSAGSYIIDTQGSSFDTVLHAYAGCSGASLGCNDDYYGVQSRIVVNAQAGDIVVIVVDGYSSNSGNFTLNIH